MLSIDDVRVKVRTRIVDGEGKLALPVIFGRDDGDEECYNSGGRGLLFPYSGRAKRIKGVDPYGQLTRIVGRSSKNKIRDIRRFVNAQPYKGVNGKPFAVLSKEAAEREKITLDRLNWFYWKRGLKPPYSFETMAGTGITFGGEDTYQVVFDLARMEDDLRVEEFNATVKERFDRLSRREIKEREGDVLKLYHRMMAWHGFNVRALVESGLLPTWQSFVAQNYVLVRLDGGYGIFRVDHTSTETADNLSVNDILDELLRRIEHDQSAGITATFSHIPTAVSVVANYPDHIPGGRLPLFHRAYSYLLQPSNRTYSYGLRLNPGTSNKELPSIFDIQFRAGLTTAEYPEPIAEEFFTRLLQ